MSVTDPFLTDDAASMEDAPIIFAMAKDLIDTYEDVETIAYEKVIAWVFDKICQNITDYRCVFKDGVKVGYYRMIPGVTETELDDLYILPEFQGQGIGTAVLRNCMEATHKPLFLYVFKRNLGAIKLYLRMGFSISEEVGNTRYILRREVDRPLA